jgi:hypothetical protein
MLRITASAGSNIDIISVTFEVSKVVSLIYVSGASICMAGALPMIVAGLVLFLPG